MASYKLDVLDAQFPLILQSGTGRIISLKNSGSIAVSATAGVVQSKENQSECRDFAVCPNNIVLNGGEKLTLRISYKPENNRTINGRLVIYSYTTIPIFINCYNVELFAIISDML